MFVALLTLSPMDFTWPDHWYVVWWSDWRDVPANVLFFVPVGYLFVLARDPGKTRPVAAAALFGLVASASIEATQQFVPLRVSSFTDVLANGSGAHAGRVAVHPGARPARAPVPGSFDHRTPAAERGVPRAAADGAAQHRRARPFATHLDAAAARAHGRHHHQRPVALPTGGAQARFTLDRGAGGAGLVPVGREPGLAESAGQRRHLHLGGAGELPGPAGPRPTLGGQGRTLRAPGAGAVVAMHARLPGDAGVVAAGSWLQSLPRGLAVSADPFQPPPRGAGGRAGRGADAVRLPGGRNPGPCGAATAMDLSRLRAGRRGLRAAAGSGAWLAGE
ncbi:MAG: VanZ family protein [Proteobacteria bacterium]|nr:VanZ family protein [Pseudomonadota bacterium]